MHLTLRGVERYSWCAVCGVRCAPFKFFHQSTTVLCLKSVIELSSRFLGYLARKMVEYSTSRYNKLQLGLPVFHLTISKTAIVSDGVRLLSCTMIHNSVAAQT